MKRLLITIALLFTQSADAAVARQYRLYCIANGGIVTYQSEWLIVRPLSVGWYGRWWFNNGVYIQQRNEICTIHARTINR